MGRLGNGGHRMLETKRIIGTVGYMGGIMSLPEPFAWSWGNMLLHTQSLCKDGDFIHADRASVSLHDHARNQLISRMQGDWIVMLDCDTAFEPDLASRLVATAQRFSLDVVTGVYAFKQYPHFPVLYMRDAETDRHEIVKSWDRSYDVFPVDAAGSGCLFIRRTVIERILSELKEGPFDRAGSTGEDMSFFRRLKKIGIEAYCAWKVEMVHLDYKQLRVSNDYDESIGEVAHEYPVRGLKHEVAAYG